MNAKIITMLLLVTLFASLVSAPITVTWATPESGTEYNNNYANAEDVNLTFRITDDNATVDDHQLAVTVYSDSFVSVQTIANDVNVRTIDGTTDQNCYLVSVTSGLAAYNCTLIWDMPLNSSMPDGVYYVDANVTSVFGTAELSDANALRTITVNTSLANVAAIRGMLLLISVVAVAGVIILGILSITMLNTDPAKTAMTMLAAVVMVAIIAMILTAIVAMF